ncbi:MAG: DUF364 domain-containing protein [Desulfococcaceae bacterium]
MPALNEEIVREVQKRSASLSLPEVRTVAISLGYTFVELSNDRMGVCFTAHSASPSCNHYHSAGSLRKKNILELTELMLSDHPLERSVGIAAVTVVSQMIMDNEPDKYKFAKVDFLDLLPDGSKIGMVGYIGPFIPVLLKRYSSLIVVDNNPLLNPGIQDNGCIISRDIKDLSDADIWVITGSCVAVGDFDQVISFVKSAKFIGIVGPSAGWLPEPAFRRGVNAVAGTKILDVAGARHVILEGGGAPDFMKYGRKYAIVKP